MSHSEEDVSVHITSDAGHDTGRDTDAAHEVAVEHRTCTSDGKVVWQVTLTDSADGPGAEVRVPDELLQTSSSQALRQLAVAALVAARWVDSPTVDAPSIATQDVAAMLSVWNDDNDFMDTMAGLVTAHQLVSDQLQYSAGLLRDSLMGDEDALLVTNLDRLDLGDTHEQQVVEVESSLGLSPGSLDEHLRRWAGAGTSEH